MPSARSTFYGLPVPALAEKLTIERLTYGAKRPSGMTLVEAHLRSNFAYFGSLDKTLSGFYVLDDAGDDYTLLDLREPKGQVWFLDHDELNLTARFDSLDAYKRWRDDVARVEAAARKSDDDAELPAVPRSVKERTTRSPTTAELWLRYRWLVWLFAQPGQVSEGEAVSTAVDTVKRHTRSEYEKAFRREVRRLADDPHLAIYWLLHFSVLGEHALRDEVMKAIATSKNPLVGDFVAIFGCLEPEGGLKVLKTFRDRRASLVFEVASELSRDVFSSTLTAFRIDPTHGLRMAQALWREATSAARREQVREVVNAPKLHGLGADYLRLELALCDGKPRPAQWLVKHDPFSARLLELAIAGGVGTGLERRLDELKAVERVLARVTRAAEEANDRAKTLADVNRLVRPSLNELKRASPVVKRLAARKIIASADHYPDVAVELAFDLVLTEAASAERLDLLVGAALAMQSYDPVQAAAKRAKKSDADARAFLLKLLLADERSVNEHHALYAKKFALEGLGAWLSTDEAVSTWIPGLHRRGLEGFTSAVYEKVLSHEGAKAFIARLSPKHRLLLATVLVHSPAPRGSSNDPPTRALKALLTTSLHQTLVKHLAKDRRGQTRYRAMLTELAESEHPLFAAHDLRRDVR